jgi:hypothetical protein
MALINAEKALLAITIVIVITRNLWASSVRIIVVNYQATFIMWQFSDIPATVQALGSQVYLVPGEHVG